MVVLAAGAVHFPYQPSRANAGLDRAIDESASAACDVRGGEDEPALRPGEVLVRCEARDLATFRERPATTSKSVVVQIGAGSDLGHLDVRENVPDRRGDFVLGS
ncbi:hypothetical protein [Nocardia sp. NPDC059239]|uniref:hypothetical protein n=1 Tax=unclassified Nocardia TaxID=2637762 RepID=UPI0036956529